MQLNFLERSFILGPVRAFMQNHFETRQLLKIGDSMHGAKALEVGCGPGFGIDLLYNKFNVSSVDAFDIEPKMVFRVRQRQN